MNEALKEGGARVSAASLAAFRILFGALMAFAVVRYYAMGWIEDLWITPQIHFPYLGPEYIGAIPAPLVHLFLGTTFLAAIAMAIGLFTRVSTAVFFLAFTSFELLDRTTYLNHYYLVSLLSFLLIFLDTSAMWSVDAWRQRRRGLARSPRVPSLQIFLLRAQLSIVYFYAGLAKLDHDWLLEAQPLKYWLARHTDLPLIGPFMNEAWMAYAASWSGMLFDLCVPFMLWHARTRGLAYLAVLGFHLATALLFPIGIFPWLMILATTIFFAPDWPQALLRAQGRRDKRDKAGVETRSDEPLAPSSVGASDRRGGFQLRPAARHTWSRSLVLAWLLVQAILPARHFFYEGETNWTERGFRFAWRVMVMEKSAFCEFHLVDAEGGESVVQTMPTLTPFQHRMVSTQPDLIRSFARYLADEAERRTGERPQVFADVRVRLNAHPRAPMIDPAVDLAQDTLPDHWILPRATQSAPPLRSPQLAVRSAR